jgi:cadmium resistance protein CadD (predicted permease)
LFFCRELDSSKPRSHRSRATVSAAAMVLQSKWLGPALLAIPLFASTNADDLVLLTIFFSQKNARTAAIVIGQLIGLGALTAASIVAARLAVELPESWIAVLGLVPIALGLRQIFAKSDDDEAAGLPAVSWWGVATVTIANGSDNLGVYIPVFTVQSPAAIAVISVTFMLLTFVWCGLAANIVRHPKWGQNVRRLADRFGPYILIAVGVWIVAKHPLIQSALFG